MSSEAGSGLAEDVVGHGVTQNTFEVDDVQSRPMRNALERGFLPDREALRDFESRYGVQTDDIF